MNSIFISYRRDDSASICGRIFESLAWYFGKDNVFKDVDSIPFGVPFPQYIASVLEQCQVTLVVIGKRWVDASDTSGQRRLDNPGDYVRIEIETALQRPDVMVIPVLVEGAGMPTADRLPESLRPLTLLNSALVRNDPDYQSDMRKLQASVERALLAHSQPLASTARVLSSSAKYEPGRANRRVLVPLGIIAVLVAIGVPVLLFTGVIPASGFLGSGGSTNQGPSPRTTLAAFCKALHDNSLDQAYSYLSARYKATVTSSSQIPNVLGSEGTLTDCAEFGSGGFLQINGTEATDTVTYTIIPPAFGTSTSPAEQAPGHVTFVQEGTDWQIDSLQG